jgi:hypothetical protein
MVWNVNNRIDHYTDSSDFTEKITLRATYGFGDSQQREQLRDILAGRDEIWTEAGGGYTAETEIIDGKRIIKINGYTQGLSMEDQMLLAAVLGHEAYRDGYKVNDTDGYGNIITEADNFNELKNASIAKILMGDRINQDYDWFYKTNMDLAFESYLFDALQKSGNMGVFDEYLRGTFNNNGDYYWKWANTNNDWQNMERYREIPLFNAKTREEVERLNKENFDKALAAYKADLAEKEGYVGDLADYIPKDGRNDKQLAASLLNDESLKEKFSYNPLTFESIYAVGCMFMSTKYGAELITGKKFDTVELNEYIKENNLYLNESDLSRERMAEIMTLLSGGEFVVELLNIETPTAQQLWDLTRSDDMYIAHVRIKKDGTGDGYHSEMVSGIDLTYMQKFGKGFEREFGVGTIRTANPWNGDGNTSFTAKTEYTMDQIARWDIFKVTPTLPYYKNRFVTSFPE